MNSKIEYTARSNCELRKLNFQKCKPSFKTVVRIKDHESRLGVFDVVSCSSCNEHETLSQVLLMSFIKTHLFVALNVIA